MATVGKLRGRSRCFFQYFRVLLPVVRNSCVIVSSCVFCVCTCLFKFNSHLRTVTGFESTYCFFFVGKKREIGLKITPFLVIKKRECIGKVSNACDIY
jgi:hypothetical protein